jgi:hypothetical protein
MPNLPGKLQNRKFTSVLIVAAGQQRSAWRFFATAAANRVLQVPCA